MELNGFLRNLEEALELSASSLNGTEPLADLECWDSLAIIGFIAMVDEQYDASLSGRQIAACENVTDLFALVAKRAAAAV